MATALSSAALDQVRPSGWALDFAQVLATAPKGTSVVIEKVTVAVPVIVGQTVSSPPQPQDVAQKMISDGHASGVYYMEVWEQDNLFLGTGTVNFCYIGVYKP